MILKLPPNFKFVLLIKVNKISLLLVCLHISLRIISSLNYDQPISNIIPLKLLSCMSKIMFLLRLMLIFLPPF